MNLNFSFWYVPVAKSLSPASVLKYAVPFSVINSSSRNDSLHDVTAVPNVAPTRMDAKNILFVFIMNLLF